MNRPSRQDLVQPSLLDRLTDHSPQQSRDTQEERAFSIQRLRQAVLRDLTWLLNAGNLASTTDLRPYPQVASSTLNYGIATPHGRNRDGLDIDVLRQQMLVSLRRFEPRLLPATLKVQAVEAREAGALVFRIEAALWAEPTPLRLVLRAELDREVAAIRVIEDQGREAA